MVAVCDKEPSGKAEAALTTEAGAVAMPGQDAGSRLEIDLGEFGVRPHERPQPGIAPAPWGIPGVVGLGMDCTIPPPIVPPGATIYTQDEHGRPCKPDAAFIWCWAGGPRWFYAKEHPVPIGNPYG
jgi:hypothetical protein